MLSSQSIQLIFSSWDVIKNIPDFQETFSNQLSEKLADSNVSEWFSGPANPHHLVFVRMIDLIVHLLGPDLDTIIEELTVQGRRHHKLHSDMIGFFHIDTFSQIADAFIEIVRTFIQEQATTKEASEVSKESVLHPGQLDAVANAWSAIFTMIRAIMKQGVKIEVKRHKRRAEKQRQEILAKQRAMSESTTSLSETSSDAGSNATDLSSPVAQTSSKGRGRFSGRGKGLSPTRGIGRAVSASLEAMRSPPGRSASGFRSGGGSGFGNKKKSKLSSLSDHKPKTTAPPPLRRGGLKQSLSMSRLRVDRS
mmetsp:Transcript_39078/g.94494  ORF Transcript_39078/g.94494 Transcript_39078/m.94494 type:complete len:308 (+) Transcript_39078:116-1039(+)